MQRQVPTDPGDELLEGETPGLLVVFSQNRAAAMPVPLDAGAVEFGRDHPLLAALADPRLSRRHFSVDYRGGFWVTELGSRNGTSVDGTPLKRGTPREVARVIRAGGTLLVPLLDMGRALTGAAVVGGRVMGAAQKASLRSGEYAAGLGKAVQIIGEAGTGKEALGRAYHAAGPAPDGPFHVVRCAALPESAVDQVLFGNGSGTGPWGGGYLRAARGGTLCHRRARRVPLSAGSPVPRDPPADLETVLRTTCRGPRARVVKALGDSGAPECQVLSGEGSEPLRIHGCALR